MNRRSSLRLFAGVTGLMLVWALMVMEQRGRPPAKIEWPSGPSAVEESEENGVRGAGLGVRPPTGLEPPTPNPAHRSVTKDRHSMRSPAKRAADAPGVKGAHKSLDIFGPSRTSAQSSPETGNLAEVAAPQLSESPPADDPPPATPPAGLPSETSDPGLSPPPPPVLKPPVLLTEPTQDGGDQQVALERGQLTTQLRLEAREGRVVLRILVRADGTVARAEVARSSGQSALDQAAVLAVGSWRFDPATRNGAAIEAWVLIPVRFVVR